MKISRTSWLGSEALCKCMAFMFQHNSTWHCPMDGLGCLFWQNHVLVPAVHCNNCYFWLNMFKYTKVLHWPDLDNSSTTILSTRLTKCKIKLQKCTLVCAATKSFACTGSTNQPRSPARTTSRTRWNKSTILPFPWNIIEYYKYQICPFFLFPEIFSFQFNSSTIKSCLFPVEPKILSFLC